MMRILIAGLLGLLLAGPAAAQPTLGVYFDPEGTQTSLQIFTYPRDFTFYVVAKGIQDFKSLEFGLDFSTSGFDNVWWGPNGDYELGLPGAINVCDPAWSEFCLSVGCTSEAEPVVVASVTLQAFDAVQDYTICLRPTGSGHGPGFVACDGTSLQPLWSPYQGCAVVNPVALPQPVGARPRSFGQVKALFGN